MRGDAEGRGRAESGKGLVPARLAAPPSSCGRLGGVLLGAGVVLGRRDPAAGAGSAACGAADGPAIVAAGLAPASGPWRPARRGGGSRARLAVVGARAAAGPAGAGASAGALCAARSRPRLPLRRRHGCVPSAPHVADQPPVLGPARSSRRSSLVAPTRSSETLTAKMSRGGAPGRRSAPRLGDLDRGRLARRPLGRDSASGGVAVLRNALRTRGSLRPTS